MVRDQIQTDSHLRLGHTCHDKQNINFHFVSVFLYVDQAAGSIWSGLGTSVLHGHNTPLLMNCPSPADSHAQLKN